MLPATVREAARRFGERTAYVDEAGEGLTYRDLDRLSDGIAAHLHGRGVDPGDVVALVLDPGLDYVLAYVALAKLGAVTAGVNVRLVAREQRAVFERAAPRLVIAAPGIDTGGRETIALEHHRQLVEPGGEPPPLPDDPDRDVAIIFTSGTTGAPKGARYGNRQLEFITQTDVGDAWGAGGRAFSGTSFAHLGFMTKLPGNVRKGTTSFIMARWSAGPCLDLIAREQLHTVAGVPTQLALMLALDDFDARDLTSVQYVLAGGGPITPGLAQEVRRRFRAQLATRYSCTEAGIGLGTAFDAPDEDAIVSVGRPHAAVALALRDPEDPDDSDAIEPGAIGEVCLRSPACMSGYWRDDAATAAAFTADGFVRTGDLGRIDERGRLQLVGRAKEMYVRGGYNVYPVEVEAVLSTHPAVEAIAVVPQPDGVMGEIGVACVIPKAATAPPDLDALRAYGRTELASYKLPERVVVLDAFPLTPGEKLDRAALAARVTRASAGQ